MEKEQRREFIKKSLLGITGAAIATGTVRAASGSRAEQEKIPSLPSRILGRTGLNTPMISVGAAGTNDPNFIKTAYYAGLKLFFSATYYGEGNNEKVVGEGLKGLPRDSFIIGTAVPADGFDGRTGKFSSDFDTNAYIRKAEASLARFGLDYVDIFMFPYASARDNVTYEPLLKALLKLKEQGKTRFLGIASHNGCEEALKAAADSKIYDVAMISYNYKIQNKTAMDEAVSFASRAGVGVVAMKTTAGAFRDKSRTKPLNTDAAFKWVLQNKDIVSIVSAMSSIEQMEKNIAMLGNLRFTPQEMVDLNTASLETGQGLYCQQCRQCVPQCPFNLEIPAAMRSYMYAYGYRNMEQAHYTLAEAGLPPSPCQECKTCNVTCASGFDVKERILDIARLRDIPREFLI